MIEAKYTIFTIAFVVCLPIGIAVASLSRKLLDAVFILLIVGTCMPSGLFGFPTDINFLSRPWYRGTTIGVEISYLDLLVLILLISSLIMRWREGRRAYWPPSLGLLLVYVAWCTLSVVVFSDPKLFGFLELTKILRGTFLFLAVIFYIRSPREVRMFVWAFVFAICYEASVCLHDRYVIGIHRIRGTLAHPNSLSTYSLQTLPIFISAFFARDLTFRLRAACAIACVASALCVLLSISRTGFAAFILLSGITFVLSTGFRLTPRNIAILAIGALGVIGMVAKSYDSIMSRLSGFDLAKEYLSEEGDRGTYFRQAFPAILENPITGVGLNNWSWWISAVYGPMTGFDMEPYPSVDIPPPARLRGTPMQTAPAHNVYLLVVTELGWPGLFIFLAFLGQSMIMSGLAVRDKNDDLCTRLRIGIALSLLGILCSSWTTWNYKQTSNFFIAHAIMAAGAVLYHFRRPVKKA